MKTPTDALTCPQMTGHGAKFGRKQEGAIAALLVHQSIGEAAIAIGVSPKTLFRWLRISEFQQSYREARRAVFLQSIARLQQASTTAVSALLETMTDAKSPSSARVRAADIVLNHARQGMEIEDLGARIGALEQAAETSEEE